MTSRWPLGAHFGIAGWSYADWVGVVYPAGVKAGDQLAYLAPFVDMIEVNSSFYRVPSRKTVEGWAKKTEHLPGFFFTAKVPQDATHGSEVSDSLAREFAGAFAPLIEAGRLRQLLAQFRWDFADDPARRTLVSRICELYSKAAPVVVEVRHNSWQSPGALEYLAAQGAAVANIDMPLARDSFSLRSSGVGADAYLRLHGRNRKAWFDRTAGRDATYDYLYSPEELDQLIARLAEIRARARSVTVVANNHFRGKAVANALELKARATGESVAVPAPLLDAYPRLREIARGGA